MVKAVFFGSFCTLANLADLERRAFNRTFKAHRIDLHWSETDYAQLIRTRGRYEGPNELLATLGRKANGAFLQDLETHFQELVDSTQLELNPWTARALAELARRRPVTRTVLVTGAPRQTGLRVLAALFQNRASAAFNLVTCKEMGCVPKPSPQLYTLALDHLNLTPDDVLAVETTQHGLQAAQDAGIRTAGLATRYTGAEDLSNADLELAGSMDLTIEGFLSLKTAA